MALEEGWSVRSAIEFRPGQIRVLLGRDKLGPSALRVFDVPLDGGAPTLIADVDFASEPVLSPDGTLVVGYTHPGGALLVRSLADETSAVLGSPLAVWDFRWSPG
jgi:hypothetical protein